MDASTAYTLIAAAFVVGYLLGHRRTPSALPDPLPPDPAALDTVRPILEAEGKIAAIKAYRERTGAGLRDAKSAVDTLDEHD